jgi:hypothetical protein
MHEEDLRWTANLILGAAFLFMLGGIIVANQFNEFERGYITLMAAVVAAIFAIVGGAIHWYVRDKINRTTIKRPGGWGR